MILAAVIKVNVKAGQGSWSGKIVLAEMSHEKVREGLECRSY